MKLRCWAPMELKDGEPDGVEVEHKVLVYGEQKQRDRTGKMRVFNITEKVAAEMVANSERDSSTGYQAPVFIGHPDDRSTEPAVGWVQSLRAAADGLYAVVKYLPDMAKRIAEGAFRFTSPTFTFAYEDQHGVERGAKFLDLGVLNTPHQKDTGSIPLAESAYQLSEVAPCDADEPSPVEGGGVPAMDEEKVKALVASALAEFAAKNDEKWTARFSELSDTIAKCSAPAAALGESDKINDALIKLGARIAKAEGALSDKDGKLAKTEADLVSLREESNGYKLALSESRINGLVNDGLENGTLEAKDVPGFGTESFSATKWLGESKFNGEKGLRTHVATSSPVVSLADRRKSAPTSKPEHAGDEFTVTDKEAIRLGFANAAEYEEMSALGVGGDPRRATK